MMEGESSYRRFLAGEQAAFEELVEAYSKNLIYFLNRYVHDLDAAENLAADTFVELLVHRQRYHFQVSFKTYLFSIGRNKARAYLRKARNFPYDALKNQESQKELLLLEDAILAQERKKAVNEALSSLKQEYRLVIHLLYFEELSYAEAAQIMGKSRKQIDNLAYQAKLSLKKLLGKEVLE